MTPKKKWSDVRWRNFSRQLENKLLDAEYVGLLHQIHKDPIWGHPYRGFTILWKDRPLSERVRGIEVSSSVSRILWNRCGQLINIFTFRFKQISTAKKPIWFIYSGMGSQWATMGKQLLRIPVFAESICKSHRILQMKGVNLLRIITTDDATVFDSVLNSYVGIVAIEVWKKYSQQVLCQLKNISIR